MALTCHFGVINYYTLIKSETPVQGTASVVNCCLYCKKREKQYLCKNACIKYNILLLLWERSVKKL